MDEIRRTFDKWAQNGRDELMEEEHGKNVLKFLQAVSFDKSFTFLDVGCGMGLDGIGMIVVGARSYTGIDPIIDFDERMNHAPPADSQQDEDRNARTSSPE